MFGKHDLKFDLDQKQLNKIDTSEWFENVNMDMDNALDYMDNLDIDNDLDNWMSNDLNVMRMKLEIDIEIDSQHSPDASRNVKTWPHGCDKLELEDNMNMVNMDKNDDKGLSIAMNN